MSSPIRVDWVGTALWPGRLGLTFAPGKKGASVLQRGVVHDRDMAGDFMTLAREGVQVIAPLIEDHEYELLGMVGYPEEAGRQGMAVVPCPIPDGHAPGDPAQFATFIDELMNALLGGQSVVVHCRGGLGRAGLTAACLLVQAGLEPGAAIALVRQTRPGAVETAEQEAFVHHFARQGEPA